MDMVTIAMDSPYFAFKGAGPKANNFGTSKIYSLRPLESSFTFRLRMAALLPTFYHDPLTKGYLSLEKRL